MIDLHIHTTCSDGEDTPKEILIKSERVGLSIISITDHDTVNAYEELGSLDIPQLFSGKIINGVELDAIVNGKAIELLVYDYDMSLLKPWIDRIYKTKAERQRIVFNELIKKCSENNIKLDDSILWDETKEFAHTIVYKMFKACLENEDNPYLQFDSFQDFYRVTSADSTHPLFIDLNKVFPSIEEVIAKAKQAGGKIFLAHLFEYSFENKEEFLERLLANYTLDGLEVYHANYTDEQSQWLISYCSQSNLLMSGGSDYHGENFRNNKLGTGKSDENISEKLISGWINI